MCFSGQQLKAPQSFARKKRRLQAKFRCVLFPRLQAASETQNTGVRCLTLRSSRAPTACRAGHQAQGLRPILRLLPVTPHRRCQLSSNVRQHEYTLRKQCASPHAGRHASQPNPRARASHSLGFFSARVHVVAVCRQLSSWLPPPGHLVTPEGDYAGSGRRAMPLSSGSMFRLVIPTRSLTLRSS